MTSNDDQEGKRPSAHLVSLKQPKIRSKQNVLECVRKLFSHVRHKKCVAVAMIALDEQGNSYMDAIVPVDNMTIDMTLSALEELHEHVYNIGKKPS